MAIDAKLFCPTIVVISHIEMIRRNSNKEDLTCSPSIKLDIVMQNSSGTSLFTVTVCSLDPCTPFVERDTSNDCVDLIVTQKQTVPL